MSSKLGIKRQKRKLSPLIPPTAKPEASDIATVAIGLIGIAQGSILSPAAVIATLKVALDLYTRNLEDKQFDPEVTKTCLSLGESIAKTLSDNKRSPLELQNDGIVTPESEIIQPSGAEADEEDEVKAPSSGLVDANGRPF